MIIIETTETEKDEKTRLRKLLNRIEAAEKWRDSGYKKKWERYYKRYRNLVDAIVDEDGKVVTDRSNISIPYPFVQVETVLPRLVESVFASRPYVTLTGTPKDAAEYRQFQHLEEKPWDVSADKHQKLLDHQHNVPMSLQDLFHGGLKTMCIYGTTVAYVGWRYDERKVIRKEMGQAYGVDEETGDKVPMIDEMGQPITELQPVEGTETVHDDPEVKFLDLGLFYVDRNAEDIDTARYCGHLCYMTKEEIQSLADQEVLKVEWDKVKKSDKKNTARDDKMALVGVPASESTTNEEDELFEVHYYYEDDEQAIIINRSYLARDGENPFYHRKKPYVSDTYTKLPGEFYGIGIIEMIEDQHDELNSERNQRMDYRSMSLRRQFTQRRGAEITPKNWTYKNHGRILVDEHDDIKQLEVPSIDGSTFNQEATIKQDMQDTTGAHDVVMGTSSAGETATTTMSKDNNSSMRFRLTVTGVEKNLLVPIARLMIQLNQQFIDDARLLDVSDDKGMQFVEVTPEDIQGEYRITAAGSSVEPMANKEAFKQRMTELFAIASKDPFYVQFPQYRKNLLKKVFEAYDIKDTDTLLPSDEEVMGAMEQQVIGQYVASLPPELQELIGMASGAPPQPQEGGTAPPQSGGGANTAMQAERGLQVIGGGGGL
ncbi:portal protein [Paenibacillus kobensis]|uniref:portal protein n=1 Tax=Paenibacillus kobensis TaxID=59841 RepID=UPI000FDB3402|nr:hypothetical protein [Paenibacillus kobensis]